MICCMHHKINLVTSNLVTIILKSYTMPLSFAFDNVCPDYLFLFLPLECGFSGNRLTEKSKCGKWKHIETTYLMIVG